MEVSVKDIKTDDFPYVFAKYNLKFEPTTYRAQHIRTLFQQGIKKVYIPKVRKDEAMKQARSFATQTTVDPKQFLRVSSNSQKAKKKKLKNHFT